MTRADHPIRSPLAERIGHTLPGRLLLFARRWPRRTALREKWRGLWRPYSWMDYLQQVRAVAMALARDGLAAGDRVAIISDNRPEWLFADLGAQWIGAISAGVYTTSPAADVAWTLNHCRARVVICEDQEQLDKVVEAGAELAHLQRIVVIDPAGTRGIDDPRLVTWQDWLAPHRKAAKAEDPEALEAQVAALDAEAPAVLVYTSGTTGRPKAAVLTARSMLAFSTTMLDLFETDERDSLLSYLPLCHVAEKIFSQFLPLTSGAVVHFGESLDTVRADLAEAQPTIFLGVPRIWEKIAAAIEVGMRNSSPEKRALYRWAVSVGQRRVAAGDSAGPGLRLAWRLANLLVLSALRERIGLARCRLAISGAAPVAPELLAWFHAIGVPIMEGWGLSESSGVSHINLPGAFRLGSVGRPVPGCECRIAEDGEVLIRGPHLFSGYLDAPEATAEAIDAEGWLHTGDLGRIDADGFLYITGRKKEIIITAGGKNLSPAKIENALKTSPYIKEACAIGDRRPFVAALIQIEPELVGDWATRRGIAYAGFEDLTRQPEVVRLIEGEVRKANAQLARVEQVRAFRLLPRELHQDDGEVTATQKLKRRVVEQRYADLIEQMYAGAPQPSLAQRGTATTETAS